MYKSKKTISLLLSSLLFVTFLFSLIFIVIESDHECTCKNDCQICEQLNVCLHVFDDNAPNPNSDTLVIAFSFAAVLCVGFVSFAKKLNTPIILKDKLSN